MGEPSTPTCVSECTSSRDTRVGSGVTGGFLSCRTSWTQAETGALPRQKPSSWRARCSPPAGSSPPLAVRRLLAALALGVAFSAGHLLELGPVETLQEGVRPLVPVVCVSGGPDAQRDDEAPQPGRGEGTGGSQRTEEGEDLARLLQVPGPGCASPCGPFTPVPSVRPEPSALGKGPCLTVACPSNTWLH